MPSKAFKFSYSKVGINTSIYKKFQLKDEKIRSGRDHHLMNRATVLEVSIHIYIHTYSYTHLRTYTYKVLFTVHYSYHLVISIVTSLPKNAFTFY